MITLIIAASFSGTKKERVKALLISAGIDCVVLLGCLPYTDLINYSR